MIHFDITLYSFSPAACLITFWLCCVCECVWECSLWMFSLVCILVCISFEYTHFFRQHHWSLNENRKCPDTENIKYKLSFQSKQNLWQNVKKMNLKSVYVKKICSLMNQWFHFWVVWSKKTVLLSLRVLASVVVVTEEGENADHQTHYHKHGQDDPEQPSAQGNLGTKTTEPSQNLLHPPEISGIIFVLKIDNWCGPQLIWGGDH